MEQIIYFYGQKGNFGCFSNFYPCKIVDNEITFNCSEQYFMWRKAMLFDPENQTFLKRLLEETNPVQIKKFGRLVKNFNGKIWDQEKYSIMLRTQFLKFSQNQELLDILLSTGDHILAEASPVDNIWGIGMTASEAKTKTQKYWKGLNLLGSALMETRKFLSVS